MNGLGRELAQLRRSVVAAQLALAQKSSESANALTDPAVQNAEIRLTAAFINIYYSYTILYLIRFFITCTKLNV